MMCRKPIQQGSTYGNWVVIDSEPVPYGSGRTTRLRYLCRCTCGVQRLVNASNLRRGLSTSCGCVGDAYTASKSTSHGMSHTPLYAVWRTMLQRCNAANFRQYKDYGGRGIKVCERWYKFENFLSDMGLPPFPGASLERKDNNKGYEPENVVWSTRISQARNKRNNVRFELGGLSLTLVEWSERLGVKKATLASRLYLYEWPIERALQPAKEAVTV